MIMYINYEFKKANGYDFMKIEHFTHFDSILFDTQTYRVTLLSLIKDNHAYDLF